MFFRWFRTVQKDSQSLEYFQYVWVSALYFSKYECLTQHTQTESFQSTQRQQNFKYTMHDANDASQCANYVRRSHSFVPKVQLEAMAELARLRHRYLQVQMTRRHTTITAILDLAILHSLSQVWGGKICVKLDVLQTCFKFYNVALVQQLQSEHFSQTRSPWTKKTFPTIWRNAAWWLRCISRVFSDFIWNTFLWHNWWAVFPTLHRTRTY